MRKTLVFIFILSIFVIKTYTQQTFYDTTEYGNELQNLYNILLSDGSLLYDQIDLNNKETLILDGSLDSLLTFNQSIDTLSNSIYNMLYFNGDEPIIFEFACEYQFKHKEFGDNSRGIVRVSFLLNDVIGTDTIDSKTTNTPVYFLFISTKADIHYFVSSKDEVTKYIYAVSNKNDYTKNGIYPPLEYNNRHLSLVFSDRTNRLAFKNTLLNLINIKLNK